MHTPNNASPDEVEFKKLTPFSRSRVLIVAACFLVFSFFTFDASGAPEETSRTTAPSRPMKKPAAAKPKVKAAVRPAAKRTAAKTKSASNAKRKTKPQAIPAVSQATKAKAESITCEIAPALPEGLEDEITKFFGLRYQMGGRGQGGFDCSGLVQKVYSDVFGIELPRSSTEQSRLSDLERVTEDELKTGDLLFFGPKRKQINHVGMYLAGGYFLHAARSEGVTISRLDDGYWKSRWIFSKRLKGLDVDYDSDEDQVLEKALAQYSADFAFGGEDPADTVSFLEAGIKINDSLEFLLSGFFLNALDNHDAPPVFSSSPSPPTTETADSQAGFRLAAIFSPLEWFKLIPSVVQTEGSSEEKGRDGDRQQLGLETWMILPSSRVAVFMAAHAKNQDDLFERPLAASPDLQTLDVALGLHYHLSDSLRFSLWGTHAYNSYPKYNEETGRSLPVDDVSFQFDIRF